MPDYNIYIHAIGTGGATNDSPTTPWSQKSEGGAFSQTSSQSSDSLSGAGGNLTRNIIRAASYAQNPDSLISTATSAIAKAFPIVAAAVACVKLAETITDNVLDFRVIETGYYKNQVMWQDFKTTVHNVFHPVSGLVQSFKTERQWVRANERNRMERDLLGDSVINSYTNRGV